MNDQIDAATRRWVEELTEARAALEGSLRALSQNAQQVARLCDAAVEDVADSLSVSSRISL